MLLNEGMITLILKVKKLGLPWWSGGEDSTIPTEGAWVQSLVGEGIPRVVYNKNKQTIKKKKMGASLVVWWQRICLPLQETPVRSLVREALHGARELEARSDLTCVCQQTQLLEEAGTFLREKTRFV